MCPVSSQAGGLFATAKIHTISDITLENPKILFAMDLTQIYTFNASNLLQTI